jgi:hypothetical protein
LKYAFEPVCSCCGHPIKIHHSPSNHASLRFHKALFKVEVYNGGIAILICSNSACAQRPLKNMLWLEMPPTSDQPPISTAPRKLLLKKIIYFLSASLLLGWFYGWASPRAFPQDKKMGFGYGMLHGALMPLALPSLLMGQDVEIFAPGEVGRIYKIGYICGINLCGLSFFGPLFWRPIRRVEN